VRARARWQKEAEVTVPARRHSYPFAEVLTGSTTTRPSPLCTDGTPFVRIEDCVEDGTSVRRAEVPGLDPEKDLKIILTSDILSIRGEHRLPIARKAG
jgi:HSP20 family molecular chaperone IbpA